MIQYDAKERFSTSRDFIHCRKQNETSNIEGGTPIPIFESFDDFGCISEVSEKMRENVGKR